MSTPPPDYEQLAARIAEDEAIDWQDLPVGAAGDAAHIDKLRRVQALSQAFGKLRDAAPRRPGEALAEPVRLFRWGHLDVRERIGAGSYGEVYRAWDETLQREVALKLQTSSGTDEVRAREYIEEARRLARVRHPNVLPVHGAGLNGGRVGLWAELVEGETLSAYLAQHKTLAPDELLDIGMALAAALVEVHRQGISHGDIKASNVMRDRNGRVLLMDFGAGGELGEGGSFTGSPLYLAPERLTAAAGSAASDIYALGVLLFHLASGAYPLMADDLPTLVERHRLGQRRRLGEFRVDLPRALVALVDTMLAPEPAQRPDAIAVLERLRVIVAAPAKRRQRLALIAAITGLSIGVLALSLGLLQVERARQDAETERRHAEQTRDFVVSLIADTHAIDREGVKELSAIELLEAAAARVDQELQESPVAQAELRLAIASSLRGLGKPKEALDLAERGLAQLRQVKPLLDLKMAESIWGVATLRADLGDLSGAEQGAREALLWLEQQPTNADVRKLRLSVRSTLARLVNLRGELIEAERLYLSIQADRRALAGDKQDPTLAMDLNNLGQVHNQLERYAEAEQEFREALQLWSALQGKENPRLIWLYNGLATALIGQDRLDDATLEADRAVALTLKVFDAQHPILVSIRSQQLQIAIKRQDYAAAERIYLEILPLAESLKHAHLDSLHIHAGLAALADSRFADAEARLQTGAALGKSVATAAVPLALHADIARAVALSKLDRLDPASRDAAAVAMAQLDALREQFPKRHALARAHWDALPQPN